MVKKREYEGVTLALTHPPLTRNNAFLIKDEIYDTDLSAEAKTLYNYLCYRADRTEGIARPSQKDMTGQVGGRNSAAAVTRAIKELTAAAFIIPQPVGADAAPGYLIVGLKEAYAEAEKEGW